MQRLNLIVVFGADGRLLMCRRRKDPYKGLLNFVGGKCGENEDALEAAHRELWEETSITPQQIKLFHLCDMTYYVDRLVLEVFVGRLTAETEVYGEENELLWIDRQQDFTDLTRFAGEYNTAHIMEIISLYERQGVNLYAT